MFPYKRVLRKARALLRLDAPRAELYDLLNSADASAALADQVLWLERLMDWIRTASVNRHGFDLQTGQLHNVRIRFLLHLLDRNPQWKKKVGGTLASLVENTSAVNLLAHVGLGQQRGLLAEATDRVLKRLLPRPAQETDLAELFFRIFSSENDAVWVNNIPSALMGQIRELIRSESPSGNQLFDKWFADVRDALLILAARVGALGTLPELRERVTLSEGSSKVQDLSFLRLSHQLIHLVIEKQPQSLAVMQDRLGGCLKECEESRKSVQLAYAALERTGVSVSLVYVLENLTSTIRRISILVKLLHPPSDHTPQIVGELLGVLVSERLSQRTLSSLVRENLHLISRKIVERAGASGEHYIARTREEYFSMLKAGMGGGVVMVVTTLLKFFLSAIGMAPFFQGVFFSLNYATGFVVLQLSGFTLATKQPSATASALAGKLTQLEEQGEVREFVNEACRMTRTQFAALMGNLILLVPVAVGLDLTMYLTTRHHFLSGATSQHVLDLLNPLSSVTIPMAALTGVYLWASSLAAGWLENWVIFNRLPEALATNRRLIRVFGIEGAKRIGHWTLTNATLLGGNVSLGILMGFTSAIGRFLGLPLDVRHVTLSAASLTFAFCSRIGGEIHFSQFILPAIGIACVGFLNFAVGYALSLGVAARARNVPLTAVRRLLRAMRVRLRNRPLEFFFPPRAD